MAGQARQPVRQARQCALLEHLTERAAGASRLQVSVETGVSIACSHIALSGAEGTRRGGCKEEPETREGRGIRVLSKQDFYEQEH